VRSLVPKIDELRCLSGIANLEASLVGFTETHLSSFINNGEITIPEYNMIRRDRTTGSGGGVIVYVLNRIKCIHRHDIQSEAIESVWIEIVQPNSSSLLVCIVYRPPNMLISWYEQFEQQLHKASCYTKNIAILGDINIDFLNDLPHQWHQLIESYNLVQLISEPTRICNNSSTLLDHIYVSREEFVKESAIFQISLSDHFGIGVCWKAKYNTHKNKHVCISYFKATNINRNVHSTVNNKMNAILRTTDIDNKVEIFNKVLSDVTAQNSRIITRRVKRQNQPKWFSNDINEAIKLRNCLKTSNQFDIYKTQRNKVVNMIVYAKSNYYKQILVQCKGNSRLLWKHFKEAIGKSDVPSPVVLKIDGDILSDSLRIAYEFNDYFTGIADKVINHLPTDYNFTPSRAFKEFLNINLSGKPKFTIPHLTEAKVIVCLQHLNERKAVGTDNISASILRLFSHTLCIPLCNIINSSIDSGTFPELWKIAKVFALHKGGSRTDLNNYRPISILSVTSKIIERHVHDSFLCYLSDNSLLSDAQSGFRKNNSCFTCLSSMINEWYSSINDDKLVGCVTLDFKKAFDVLSHEIILKKLELYGCDKLVLSWFTSYLSHRSQSVHVNGKESKAASIVHGVPQGSILGPLLFILFINDIVFEVKYSKLFIYADDTSLSCSDSDINNLRIKLDHDLLKINAWCVNNRIVINSLKSKSMLICSPQKRFTLSNDNLNVAINGENLENVDSQKVLGLIIDKNLTWKPHIDRLHVELSKIIGLLWRNRHILCKINKLMFYNSYIQSKIDFCLPIWGSASKVFTDKILLLQKKSIRIICNADFTASTYNLFLDLNIMNIYQRYEFQLCTTVFKTLNSSNSPLSKLLTLKNNTQCPYNLRSAADPLILNTPFPRKESYKHSFSYAAAFAWNRIPSYIRMSPSLSVFKYSLKKYIIA
jgi:hypothetical protein